MLKIREKRHFFKTISDQMGSFIICSKTAAEIMELFRELNEKGHTVIIVTHDLEIAKQCDRIIEISDGRIKKE